VMASKGVLSSQAISIILSSCSMVKASNFIVTKIDIK
jgi:hypothetical protein